MFPYTEKYTESEYDIKKNNLLYKYTKNTKILSTKTIVSNILRKINTKSTNERQFQKSKQQCYLYNFYNSYFVNVVYFVICRCLYILYLYICIYIHTYTCRSLTRVGMLAQLQGSWRRCQRTRFPTLGQNLSARTSISGLSWYPGASRGHSSYATNDKYNLKV